MSGKTVNDIIRDRNTKAHSALKARYAKLFEDFSRSGAFSEGMDLVKIGMNTVVYINGVLKGRVPQVMVRERQGAKKMITTESVKNRVISTGGTLTLYLDRFRNTSLGLKAKKVYEADYGKFNAAAALDDLVMDRKALDAMMASVVRHMQYLTEAYSTGRKRSTSGVWAKVSNAFRDYALAVVKSYGLKPSDFPSLKKGHISRSAFIQIFSIDAEKNNLRTSSPSGAGGAYKLEGDMKTFIEASTVRKYSDKFVIDYDKKKISVPQGDRINGRYTSFVKGKAVRPLEVVYSFPKLKPSTSGVPASNGKEDYNTMIDSYNRELRARANEFRSKMLGSAKGAEKQALTYKLDGLNKQGKETKRGPMYQEAMRIGDIVKISDILRFMVLHTEKKSGDYNIDEIIKEAKLIADLVKKTVPEKKRKSAEEKAEARRSGSEKRASIRRDKSASRDRS